MSQHDLNEAVLLAHRGLITGQMFDQDAAMALRPAFARFLDTGGRWFFNGHMVRPLVAGMATYRPMQAPRPC